MDNHLFNQNLMKKLAKDKELQLTVTKHDLIKNHLSKLENGDFKSETSNYLYFYEIILKEILGYDLQENILFDEKEDTGRGKSEFVLKDGDKKFMVVELKGSDADLDKPQNRVNDKRTPVDQAFDYAQHTGDIDWIMVSNYNEFRLYNWHTKGKYISFTFEELLNKEVFSYFMLSFSCFSQITSGYADKLIQETILVEKKLEKNFYKLFHETRLMLLKEIEENNDLTREEAIHYAQLILNRYMFICFAEDIENLLPSQLSTQTLSKPIKDGDIGGTALWRRLNELFEYIDMGNDFKGISKYNGGLFKDDLGFLKIRDLVDDSTFFKETWQKWDFEKDLEEIDELIGPHGAKINPIYKNLLVISSFDFSSELDVNILGHVFENSIGDIEELKADDRGRRKKDGVFYTPEYITDYICRNTIIPYLSLSGEANTVEDLVKEYWGTNIDKLDAKLKNIKIVDPACGSGAFLNKAADVLLEIHEAIHNELYKEDKSLNRYIDNIGKRREILLNNIYGVDLNEESVEITKLSLFLKVCKKGLALPNLDDNIKCGNSLIDDKEFAGDKAFNWEEEFKAIFDDGGFDVVVGNPPYVRADAADDNYQKQREWMRNSEQYETLYEKWDLFLAFIEKGLKLIRNNGMFSFIVSNSFNTSKFADKSKKFILNNYYLKQIDFFKDVEVFEGVGVESVILTIKKSPTKEKTRRILHKNSFSEINELSPLKDIDKIFRTSIELNWDDKFENTILMGDICFISKGMVLNSDEKKAKGEFKKDDLISDSPTEINIKPYTEAKYIKRYKIENTKYLEWDSERCPSKISRPTFPDLYMHPKIIRGATTEGVFDKDCLMCNHSIYIFLPFHFLKNVSKRSIENSIKKWTTKTREELESISIRYNIKYILTILNSKFAVIYLNSIRRHRMEYYFYPDDFKRLPIKKLSLNEQQPFIQKADQMLELNKTLQNEINSFKDWLNHIFEVEKFSKKLEKYYELSLDEFLAELKKKKVDVKNRENFTSLKEEFEKSVSKIRPLLQEIEETDKEIDQMVYELYGLTDDEIKIIEDSLT